MRIILNNKANKKLKREMNIRKFLLFNFNRKDLQVKLLFKEGDDLRKDQVVMQIFKVFDELCK